MRPIKKKKFDYYVTARNATRTAVSAIQYVPIPPPASCFCRADISLIT